MNLDKITNNKLQENNYYNNNNTNYNDNNLIMNQNKTNNNLEKNKFTPNLRNNPFNNNIISQSNYDQTQAIFSPSIAIGDIAQNYNKITAELNKSINDATQQDPQKNINTTQSIIGYYTTYLNKLNSFESLIPQLNISAPNQLTQLSQKIIQSIGVAREQIAEGKNRLDLLRDQSGSGITTGPRHDAAWMHSMENILGEKFSKDFHLTWAYLNKFQVSIREEIYRHYYVDHYINDEKKPVECDFFIKALRASRDKEVDFSKVDNDLFQTLWSLYQQDHELFQKELESDVCLKEQILFQQLIIALNRVADSIINMTSESKEFSMNDQDIGEFRKVAQNALEKLEFFKKLSTTSLFDKNSDSEEEKGSLDIESETGLAGLARKMDGLLNEALKNINTISSQEKSSLNEFNENK